MSDLCTVPNSLTIRDIPYKTFTFPDRILLLLLLLLFLSFPKLHYTCFFPYDSNHLAVTFAPLFCFVLICSLTFPPASISCIQLYMLVWIPLYRGWYPVEIVEQVSNMMSPACIFIYSQCDIFSPGLLRPLVLVLNCVLSNLKGKTSGMFSFLLSSSLSVIVIYCLDKNCPHPPAMDVTGCTWFTGDDIMYTWSGWAVVLGFFAV